MYDNGFNTQPPEGGCLRPTAGRAARQNVSTHSHPKVAAPTVEQSHLRTGRFNTQPPEGGCPNARFIILDPNGFQHTATRRWLQPRCALRKTLGRFQHTATRRWLPDAELMQVLQAMFQHTATRRWLPAHSYQKETLSGFNTQPPEGGCDGKRSRSVSPKVSTHSHPKVAALDKPNALPLKIQFQHTATRRWLPVLYYC